jgi:FkbM family methyltransferase
MGISPLTIIDIGASRGMFSRCAHRAFTDSVIHAFEPLKDCYEELCQLKKNMMNLHCYNVALGAEEADAMIHHSSYEYSSSLLEMEHLHKEAFPYAAGEHLEKVRVRTLDAILDQVILRGPVLMKIDVQGYEKYVLEGARRTLQQTHYIVCEMSVQPLYKGQALFHEIYSQLSDLGFSFSGQVGEVRHPESAEVLQMDGLFVRRRY